MDILQLIDRLEELFNAAKAVPFTHNVVVDEDRMLELIDQMRIAIPEEVKKAQQVMAQRDRVMAQAQEEANRTLQLSRDKAEQMVQKDMIVQEAQRRADQIVSQARAEAESTRRWRCRVTSGVETVNSMQSMPLMKLRSGPSQLGLV